MRGRGQRRGAAVALALLVAAPASVPAAAPDVPPQSLLGMNAGLEPASLDLAVGDRATFTVRLWFDPPPGGMTSMLLDLDNGAWRFVFTSAGTDTTRLRLPYSFEGPGPAPDEVVTVNSAWSLRDNVVVPLLSPAGEQIPPGHYTVRAEYTNIAPADAPQAAPDADLEYWSGTLSSPPVDVTVYPRNRRPVPVVVPSGISFDEAAHGGEQVGWGWSTATRTISVTPRPGYAVAVHWEMVMRDRGGEVVYEGSGDNTTGKWPASAQLLWPDISTRLKSDEPFTYEVKLEVFESSVLPGHLWNPRAGDYRVLWHHTFGGKYR